VQASDLLLDVPALSGLPERESSAALSLLIEINTTSQRSNSVSIEQCFFRRR
jgi:hypothetical protein